jgi:hypothetical protein
VVDVGRWIGLNWIQPYDTLYIFQERIRRKGPIDCIRNVGDGSRDTECIMRPSDCNSYMHCEMIGWYAFA